MIRNFINDIFWRKVIDGTFVLARRKRVKFLYYEIEMFFFFFALWHLPSFFFLSRKIKETTLVDFCERILWCIHRVERMRAPFKPSLLLRSTLLFLITVPFTYLLQGIYVASLTMRFYKQIFQYLALDDWLLLLVSLFILSDKGIFISSHREIFFFFLFLRRENWFALF